MRSATRTKFRTLPDADEMIGENEAAPRKLEKPAIELLTGATVEEKVRLRDGRPLDVGHGVKDRSGAR